jgi:hypothetical protein
MVGSKTRHCRLVLLVREEMVESDNLNRTVKDSVINAEAILGKKIFSVLKTAIVEEHYLRLTDVE